ncbi:MAG: peptide chain release factor 2 [Patescibacteria group bacterium]|nr:peptide chain release factor 2 [Patescibacteria group bacterium]
MSKTKTFRDLREEIKDLSDKFAQAILLFDLPKKEAELQVWQTKMSAPDFWQDREKVKDISQQVSFLEETINRWRLVQSRLAGLQALAEEEEADKLALGLLADDLDFLQKEYKQLSQSLYWQGQYDNLPAIVTINAGAGGVDAQDWAQMLERMYLRFAEQKNWSVAYLSRSVGNEAGIKSATFKISGPYAYGHLKNEAGVHRLVRLSPYDADKARHTSFAMVIVIPEISQAKSALKEEDLKIDTFRASGHGGQSVNTTDSAVRITHLPTGISATCQNERSQGQNKKQALAYLQSKLEQYYQSEKEEEKRILRGEYTEAAWGNQIRSYVLHPYKLVKDHRTDFELTDPAGVLDGDLMPLIIDGLSRQNQ